MDRRDLHIAHRRIWILVLCAFLAVGAGAQKQSELFYNSGVLDGQPLYYLAYSPQGGTTKLPLLLYLHGATDKGNGNQLSKLKNNGLPRLIEEGADYPMIIISPQLPKTFDGDWRSDLVDEIFQHVRSNFPIDETRIYLTGFSLGGGGAWRYAMAYPEKLSAVVPIAGTSFDPERACSLKNLPVWAFHGTLDPVVPHQGSLDMVEEINRCGGNAKLTSFPNVKHYSWRRAYKDPNLFIWLLKRSKRPSKSDVRAILEEVKEPEFVEGLTEVAKLPNSLKETSGLSISESNLIWSHNDSRGLPYIIGIDTLGAIQQLKRVTNAANYDWEDMTSDQDGNIYIGDFGNNTNTRKEMQVYRVPNPSKVDSDRIAAEKIEFQLPDQLQFPPHRSKKNFDIESMIYFKDSLFLFTKNRTSPFNGITKIYRVAANPGSYVAELVDSLQLGRSHMLNDWVTSALSVLAENTSCCFLTRRLRFFPVLKDQNSLQATRKNYISAISRRKKPFVFMEITTFISLMRSLPGKLVVSSIPSILRSGYPNVNRKCDFFSVNLQFF